MSSKIFYADAGMGRKVKGQALVASDGFSARYDLDRIRGVFSRPEHKLAGESYRGRVLILDAAKGGVATAWMLHEMASRGVMPAALVLNRANPIMVQGAALADLIPGLTSTSPRQSRTAPRSRSIRRRSGRLSACSEPDGQRRCPIPTIGRT